MGIFSSLLGGIFGTASTKSTNKTNAQIAADTNATNRAIAQETNAANAALAQQQNEWNLEQWNRENEYNSPANQVALLEQAGLNGLGYNTDSSQSSHIESAQLANQQTGAPMVGATMQPTDYSWLTDLSQNLANVQKTNAETSNIQQNTKLGSQLFEFNEKHFGQIITESDLKNEAQSIANDITRDTSWSNRASAGAYWKDYYKTQEEVMKVQRATMQESIKYVVDSVKGQFDTMQKNLKLLDQAIEGNDIDLKWLPIEKQQEYAQRIANLAKTKAETGLANASASNLNASTNKINAETIGIQLENGVKASTYSDSISKLKADARKDMMSSLCYDSPAIASYLNTDSNLDDLSHFMSKCKNGNPYSKGITDKEREVYNHWIEMVKNQKPVKNLGDIVHDLSPFSGFTK